MIKSLIALALLSVSTIALASDDPVKDTRAILAGTVSTAATKRAYTSGARDTTAAFKGALAAYKAVRAAEKPTPIPTPDPIPADSWMQCAGERGLCTIEGTARVRYGNVTVFVEREVTGSIPCTNEAFGRDPTPGFEKSCSSNGRVIFPTPAPTPLPPPPVPVVVVVPPPAPPVPLPVDGWVKSANGIRAGGYAQIVKDCPAPDPTILDDPGLRDRNRGVIGGIYNVVSWGWVPNAETRLPEGTGSAAPGDVWTLRAGNGGYITQYTACLVGVTQAAMPG